MLQAALVPFLVFALFPFYHMTLTSLKTDRELYDRHAVPLIIKQGPTLEHYTKLIMETAFLTWTKNSLVVTALSTGVSVVMGTIAAYALARLKAADEALLRLDTREGAPARKAHADALRAITPPSLQ
jgi:ABC-type glycerol-3-phosphate transport system permease component